MIIEHELLFPEFERAAFKVEIIKIGYATLQKNCCLIDLTPIFYGHFSYDESKTQDHEEKL